MSLFFSLHLPPALPRQHVGPVMVQHFQPGGALPRCHQGGCHPSHEGTGQCFYSLLWTRPLGPITLRPLPTPPLLNALMLSEASMTCPYSFPIQIYQGLDPTVVAIKDLPSPEGQDCPQPPILLTASSTHWIPHCPSPSPPSALSPGLDTQNDV